MNVEKIVQSLRNGHIACFPTETLYALAVDALNPSAVQKMYRVKKRSLNKPCAIMLSNINMIEQYAEVNNKQMCLIKELLPGSVTFILKKRNDCSLNTGEKIGIRIPNNDIALKILRKFNRPILNTSANLANHGDAKCFAEIPKELLSQVDSYIQDDNDISGIGSTVIDITTNPFRVLRTGEISISIE